MSIGHRKEIRKLTFRALALRRSESRNCGLCLVTGLDAFLSSFSEKDDKNASKPVLEF